MKICTKCGAEKEDEDFGWLNSKKKSRRAMCKECAKIAQYEWGLKNRDKQRAASAKWVKENPDRAREIAKKTYVKNKDKRSVYHKARYIDKKEPKLEYAKNYRAANRAILNEKLRDISGKPSKSEKYIKELPVTDEPEFVDGVITVVCKYCNERFTPTSRQVNKRIQALTGKSKGELNFYCSEECKELCPTFGFKPHVQIDPRSSQYVPDSETKEARRCQRQVRKALLALQMDAFNYTFCEKCGSDTPSKSLQLHHTKPVSIFGKEAISSDSHILLCVKCHPSHAQCLLQL